MSINFSYVLKLLRSQADNNEMPIHIDTYDVHTYDFGREASVRLVHPISGAVGAEFHVDAPLMHDKGAFIKAFDSAIRKAERALYPDVMARRAAAAKLAATASQYYQFRIGGFADLSKVRK